MSQEENYEQKKAATPATSAAQKLEKFFNKLDEQEKQVISNLVRASLLQAAEHFEKKGGSSGAARSAIPDFVTGITGANAPSLVKSLRFPGTLAAHSIPGCNRRALEELRKVSGTTVAGKK